ncbi:unnamed protein product, partial [Meganyctiphanes norvegica]
MDQSKIVKQEMASQLIAFMDLKVEEHQIEEELRTNQNYAESVIVKNIQIEPCTNPGGPMMILGENTIKQEWSPTDVGSTKLKNEMDSQDNPRDLRKCSLALHQVIHSGDIQFQFRNCGKRKRFTDKSNPVIHQRTQGGEEIVHCSQCGNSFAQDYNIALHHIMHSGEKPCQCIECVKNFTNKLDFTTHMRAYSEEKTFQCGNCVDIFKYKHQPLKHKRIHSREKPFKCSQCGKGFSRKYDLILHHRIHSGEKPFQCSECDKSFTQASTLTIH